MLIVGVECTAHTFGVGVVRDGKILSNVRDMYKPEKGGIVPMDSARHHGNVALGVWTRGLEEAGVNESEVEAIAVSNAPGLAPCLHEGMKFAKSKAEELEIILIGVNHCIAHLEIGRHEGANDPVLLYASGANTQVIAFSGGKYRVFGETLDLGIGNFIDKFARHVGIGFPGGPSLEKEAVGGNYIELPYSMKGMDVSFSGMQTKLQQLFNLGGDLKNLAYSMQETAFSMLVEASERAMAHTGKSELVLGGGVACNSRLQEMCRIMCEERRAKFFCPSKDLLVDNGAMIGFTGELMLESGVKNEKELEIQPRERTDMVNVVWR
jgi:N6-L-threonylcarbamoyladenine synthase